MTNTSGLFQPEVCQAVYQREYGIDRNCQWGNKPSSQMVVYKTKQNFIACNVEGTTLEITPTLAAQARGIMHLANSIIAISTVSPKPYLIMLEKVRSLLSTRTPENVKLAVNDAEVFIEKLFYYNPSIAIPIVSLANDGEVNFFWKTKNLKLDLGFYGDKTYSYYAKNPKLSNEVAYGDDISNEKTLPEAIIKLLSV